MLGLRRVLPSQLTDANRQVLRQLALCVWQVLGAEQVRVQVSDVRMTILSRRTAKLNQLPSNPTRSQRYAAHHLIKTNEKQNAHVTFKF